MNKLIAILVLIIITSSRTYAIEPVDLLKNVWDNEGTIQLYGRVSTVGVYGDKNVASEIELYWLPPKKIRREFYTHNQLRLILVADETSEWRYFPQRNYAVFSGTTAESKMTPTRWKLLQRNYKLHSLGQQKILNRPVELIEITPKSYGNPSRKLWLDKKQPIILRFEQYNCDTKKILTSYFTELNFNKKIDPALFGIPTSAKISKQPATAQRKYQLIEAEKYLRYSLKTATYLPIGYIFDGCYLWHPRFRSDGYSIQLRYTDGLNTISIFEHPVMLGGKGKERPEHDRRWQQGHRGRNEEISQRKNQPQGRIQREHSSEMREYFEGQQGRVIRINKGKIQCVLVADLPQNELQKIAQGLN